MIAEFALVLAQSATSPSPIRFEDATASSGIALTTTSGSDPITQIVEAKGGGVAIIDFDGDGDFDLFFPNGATLASPQAGPGARLYENLGGLRFRDVTAASGIDHQAWSFGSAVGDIDSDGNDDIYIACLGPDRLYRGLGGGKFADATASAGLGRDDDFSTSAAFADLDADGDLDLYVTNYLRYNPAAPIAPAHFRGMEVMGGPRGVAAEPDRLYRNDGGVFTDITESAGIAAQPARYGLNAVAVDFTGDGRIDIFVGNDSMPNALLENLGGLKFRDAGPRLGCSTNIDGAAQATMGIALGDVNGDARPDLLTTVFSDDTNTLFASTKDGFFSDASARYGIGTPSRTLCGWAAAFLDLDHDADEDLFIVNGHVYPQATSESMNSTFAQPRLLMVREGDRFVPVSDPTQPWLSERRRDRSAVFADLDSDGDVDAVVTGLNEPVQVLRNLHNCPDDWVEIRLDDRSAPGNRHGVGARVTLGDGVLRQSRFIIGGGPFQSNQWPVAHFGVPKAATDKGALFSVEVMWPQGDLSRHEVSRGALTTLTRPAPPAPR